MLLALLATVKSVQIDTVAYADTTGSATCRQESCCEILRRAATTASALPSWILMRVASLLTAVTVASELLALDLLAQMWRKPS